MEIQREEVNNWLHSRVTRLLLQELQKESNSIIYSLARGDLLGAENIPEAYYAATAKYNTLKEIEDLSILKESGHFKQLDTEKNDKQPIVENINYEESDV